MMAAWARALCQETCASWTLRKWPTSTKFHPRSRRERNERLWEERKGQRHLAVCRRESDGFDHKGDHAKEFAKRLTSNMAIGISSPGWACDVRRKSPRKTFKDLCRSRGFRPLAQHHTLVIAIYRQPFHRDRQSCDF